MAILTIDKNQFKMKVRTQLTKFGDAFIWMYVDNRLNNFQSYNRSHN
jgi:hypothetical protein